MILSSSKIADYMKRSQDPLVITPSPELARENTSNTASVDLRLGAWFVTKRARRFPVLDVWAEDQRLAETSISERHYVPFSSKFILHPRDFVLAVTLEWVRIPLALAGMVAGKSSWGRRGLIVETAPGIHPGFSGCLTLELTNVGEIPIAIKPGARICQLFLHVLDGADGHAANSRFFGQRQPRLGAIGFASGS